MRKIAYLIIALMTSIIILSACGGGNSAPPQPEITPQNVLNGNITNNGLVATDGEYIYYSDISADSSLCKQKLDGTDKTQLNTSPSSFINVKNNIIYYIKSAPGFIAGSVNKMNIDGTNDTKLNDVNSKYATVIDNWIYYAAYSHQDGFGVDIYCLYKMKLDGTSPQLLSTTGCKFFDVSDDGFIYFIGSSIEKMGIFRVSTNGGETVKVSSDLCWKINISNNWIYYGDADNNQALYKMRTDGTEKTLLDNSHAMDIIVKGSTIYYTIQSDAFSRSLYKINTDGTGKKQIGNVNCENIYLIGKSIYYVGYSDEKFYKINADGTNNLLVN